MTVRPAPLRAAALLAAGFVAIRVVYRILFHGADGSGPVVLPLPEVRLPPPFAHVVLLGPATVDGVAAAAASALPIAATILAFGLLNAVVDLPRLILRISARGPFSGLGRALAVAWATLPALADAARSVRAAQKLRGQGLRGQGLRGERVGVRILSPLLERTLERAAEVAATLELRGLAGRGLDGDCEAPVRARNLTVGFGGAEMPVLTLDDLHLRPGTLTLVTGPTGSGKTTLLRTLAGLHTHIDGGWTGGRLEVVGHDRDRVAPRDLARRVGVVRQNPRAGFATERVRDEIGLAPVLRGVAPVLVAARVADVASRLGIADLLDRRVRDLSAGQAMRVAIAAAVIDDPILLLVDEPLADLDTAGRESCVALLGALAHDAGICVVVAEHRADLLRPVSNARLRLGGIPDQPRAARDRASTAVARAAAPGEPTPVALRARGVTVRHGGVLAVDRADLEVGAREIVAITGPNGAGKSSLLTALALDRGVESAGRVALVPDHSDDLFVYDTVAAECRRADRVARRAARAAHPDRAGRAVQDGCRSAGPSGPSPSCTATCSCRPTGAEAPSRHRPGVTATTFGAFLGLGPDALAERLERHPRDLSVGERRLLALAIQLAPHPAVLLVDEPTRGLDPGAAAAVLGVLRTLADEGVAVAVASHDPAVIASADRVLAMRAGILSAAPAPELPAEPRRPVAADRGQDAAAITGPAGADTAVAGADAAVPGNGIADDSPPESAPAGLAATTPAAPLRRRRAAAIALAAANLVALAAFAWPLVAAAVPSQADAAVPVVALALAPLAALVVVATLDGRVRSAHLLALLGTLAAIGAAVRIASTGVGGVEAMFILLILAGSAYGARFGMLLGMASIALSTLVTGTFGPWTPFQMFACGWVAAGAGMLPRTVRGRAEIAMLCVYGVAASYAFGLVMNLWFWPFAVGYGTGISYDADAPIGVNIASFLVYSLVSSTISWDTLRALTTVVGLVVVGRPMLAALRRSKPLTPRSTSPRGGGTRTRRSTARDAAAARR